MTKIEQIGETSAKKECRKKIAKYLAIQKEISEKRGRIEEIKEKIDDNKTEIARLQAKLKLNEDQEAKIKLIEKKTSYCEAMRTLSSKARDSFLKDLLNYVNKSATELLRRTTDEPERWHQIEIDSDYKFSIIKKDGEVIDIDEQANRGNMQISMMCFFFSLSAFLDKKMPYVLDNPLMRLDRKHEARLFEQLLEKGTDQLVMHVIPEREYNARSFAWMKPHLNVQNWLYRDKYSKDEWISFAKRIDADRIAELAEET